MRRCDIAYENNLKMEIEEEEENNQLDVEEKVKKIKTRKVKAIKDVKRGLKNKMCRNARIITEGMKT